MLQRAGFAEIELVTETGFNSSPITKGVLFHATKHDIHVENALSASTHTNNKIGVSKTDPKSEIQEQEA